jgi:hypothetical protein
LASYETLHVENNFPALPVRTGVDAFVTFDRFDSRDEAVPRAEASERLRLAPTGRSLLR